MPSTSYTQPADGLSGADRLDDVCARDLMTPGIVVLVEDASLRQVFRALREHRVHAVLVAGRTTGQPLGWATSRGLLGWIGRDDTLAFARDAITEPAVAVEPGDSARTVLRALAGTGASRVLVRHSETSFPEGVVTDSDLVAFAAR